MFLFVWKEVSSNTNRIDKGGRVGGCYGTRVMVVVGGWMGGGGRVDSTYVKTEGWLKAQWLSMPA